jgi:4a-hydroxytetrahydrobiopterin dehydratase
MCDDELAMRTCRPLPAGTPPLEGDELAHLLGHADGWEVVGGRLTRGFRFPDHYQTMAFVNAVAWISHREDHHPEMVVGYDTCTLHYSTHSVGGLSENDFICAAKVDHLVGD